MNKAAHLRILVAFTAVFIILAKSPARAGAAEYRRVISLSPIITETIYLVGAEGKLVADTTYCVMPEDAKYKEKIGSVTHMNVEKIIHMAPDLVIASQLSNERQLQSLEKQSIKVVRSKNPKTFEQMCELTLMIGTRLGKTVNATKIVDRAKNEAYGILALTRALEKPTVFFQIGLKPLHSANKDMFLNEYIRFTGGLNIAENESSGVYSREKVLAKNPKIILVATMGSSKKAGQLEKKRWMAFKSMDAVKNNRIHVLDPEMICSPTPTTFVKGLKELLPLIHPELSALNVSEGNKKNDSP